LKLNEQRTRLMDIRQEGIRFLGFMVTWRQGRSGRSYPHVEAHTKSLTKLRAGMREILNRGTLWKPCEEVVQQLNLRLKGWAGYFHYGNSTQSMAWAQESALRSLRRWLWRKHGSREALWSRYSDEELHDVIGLYRMPLWAKPQASMRSDATNGPRKAGCGKTARPV